DVLECGDHVLGRHLSTIVEFDAMAEMERPRFEIGGVVPVLGEFRLDREVGTHARQPVEDEIIVNVLFAGRRAGGVQAAERGANRYAHDALPGSVLRRAYRSEQRYQQEEPERPRTLNDAHERPPYFEGQLPPRARSGSIARTTNSSTHGRYSCQRARSAAIGR